MGKFSQYAKSRHVTFRGPKAMVIHGKREAAVPEEEAPAPLPPPAEGQAASPEKKTTTDE